MSDEKTAGSGCGVLNLDWALLFYWMIATTTGWLMGWLLLPTIALVTAGVGVGVAQSLVLVGRIPRSWRWILSTAIGWMVGLVIVIPLVPAGMGFLSGMIIGSAVGIAQYIPLRSHFAWAGWWMPVSTLAWAAALSLAPPSGVPALPPLVFSAVVSSLLTGTVLEFLLRHPKQEEDPAAT